MLETMVWDGILFVSFIIIMGQPDLFVVSASRRCRCGCLVQEFVHTSYTCCQRTLVAVRY